MEPGIWVSVVSDSAAGTSWELSRRTVLRGAVAFLIAVVLVYLLGRVIGWGQTMSVLERGDLVWIGVACVSTMLCLVTWAKTWQIVLSSLGVGVSFRRLVVTFYAASFANYVTPMGQAGGEPFIAFILSRDTGATFEQSLASVIATDVLRLFPFFNVGIIGAVYLLVAGRLPGDTVLYILLIVVLAVAVPVGIVGLWIKRFTIRRVFLRLLQPVADRTTRVDLSQTAGRIDRLFGSIELIANSPKSLLVAIVFAYAGWILFALPLYFSAIALGFSISLLLVSFLVPVTVIAGSTPSPGGLAVIEGTLVAFLVALVALSTSEALALTLLYRVTSYWIVIVLGGIAAMWVVSRSL